MKFVKLQIIIQIQEFQRKSGTIIEKVIHPMESKIKRHQSSKQKGKSYQRTLSCKFFAKGQSMPSVGQYMIKKKQDNSHLPTIVHDKKASQEGVKITKNIKLILKEKHFQPASQVINDVVNKKIANKSLSNLNKFHAIQNQSKERFRPISAQVYEEVGQLENIDESVMLKEAYEFDRKYYSKQQEQKKNTFMVKQKNCYPKYIQGYNLIKLDDYSKTEELNKLQLQSYSNISDRNCTQPMIAIGQDERENNFGQFLPTEYYIIDDDTPQQLMEKYASKDGKNTIGQSKWFDNGNQIWKKCRILGFDQTTERWSIEWLHTGKRKQVSRNNLRFDKQDKAKYQQKICKAERYREQSEVFLKYNWMIDLMQSPTHEIDSHKQDKIVELATKGKIKKAAMCQTNKSIKTPLYKSVSITLKKLLGQIKTLYIRSNHQAQFNATLPFNQERKKYFIKFLPQCLFHPNKQTQIMTHSKIKISKQSKKELQHLFASNLSKIKQKSSLANPSRLKILESLNKIEEELEKCVFFKLDYKHKVLKNSTDSNQISLQQAKQFVQKNIREVFYMICCRICDLEYFVGAQLDPIYLQKKSIGNQQFMKIINSYKKFLYLVDFRLENQIERLFISTLTQILQPFQQWNNKQTVRISNNKEVRISNDQEVSNKQEVVSSKQEAMSKQETINAGNNQGASNLQDIINKKGLQLEDQVSKLSKFRSEVQKFNVETKYSGMKIKVTLQIKDGKLESTPQIQKVKQFLFESLQKLTQRAKDINCVTKSYIEPVRPNNKLHVLQKPMSNQCNTAQNKSIKSDSIQKQSNQVQLKDNIKEIRQSFYTKVNKAFAPIQSYIFQIQNMVSQISAVSSDVKKRMQKKNNYNQIEQSIQLINNISRRVEFLIGKQKMNYLVLSINCQEIMSKLKTKISQTMRQIYKLLHERITRDNQKLEKQIDSIVQILDKQPTNIDQMIELQTYANTIVPEQFDKINIRVNSTAEKVSLLQKTNCKVQYKDFQACFKIYVKPLKVTKRRAECLKTIQYSYKRTFGQQLTKQTLTLLQEIKQCEQKKRELIQVHSLKEMEAAFMAYSRLNEKIKKSIQKMQIIQRRQQKMNWKPTNFEALEELKEEFEPFFKLISSAKNFHYQVQSQMQEPFYSIDANTLKKDIQDSCISLQILQKEVFGNNPKILAIVQQVISQYNSFKKYIPMMVALRNQDLKDRHWSRIKKITGHQDIQNQSISISQLLNRNIHNFTNQIIEISEIASKQLTYQKQLNRLKKQWKEVKLKVCFCSQSNYFSESKKYLQRKQSQTEKQNSSQTQKKNENKKLKRQLSALDQNKQKNGNSKYTQNNKENIKIISNLKQVRNKAQDDIFQAQTILSTDYVKFLEADIIAWRNSILYKVHDTVDYWNRIQMKVLLFFGLFSNKTMQQEIPTQFSKFKIIDRTWKASISQIESQPSMVELLQSKTAENMRYMEELMEDIEKQISKYFQKRKQDVTRLNCLSGEQMMKAYSATSSFGYPAEIEQFIVKCFPGIKRLIKSDERNIVFDQEQQEVKQTQDNDQANQIKLLQTNLHECLWLNSKINLISKSDQECNYMNPDKIVQSIDKQIKKTLISYLLKLESPMDYILANQLALNLKKSGVKRVDRLNVAKSKIRKGTQKIERIQKDSVMQIKLLRMRIQFTFNVEEAIINEDPSTKLRQLLNYMNQNRDAFLYAFKEGQATFIMDHRLNIQSLILIQLCNQINTLEFLIQSKVTSVDNFQWLSQIRTYMRPDALDDKVCEILVFIGVYRNRYNFSLVNTQSYIASYNTSKMFFEMAMALKQNMLVCISGNSHSGKVSTINHLGQRLGRQVTLIYCHKMMSQQTIIDFIRMGVSGLWTVSKNIYLMSNEMMSFFSSTMQVVWSSLKQCSKKFSVNIHNTIIKGSCDSLGFFITMQTPKVSLFANGQITMPKLLRDYFRTISLVKPDSSFVISTLLKAAQLIDESIQPKIMSVYKEIDFFLRKLYLKNIQRTCSVGKENQRRQIGKVQREKNVSIKSIQQLQQSKANQNESQRVNQFGSYLNVHELNFYKLVSSFLINITNSQDANMMEDEIFEKSIVEAVTALIVSDQIKIRLIEHLKSMFKFKHIDQKTAIGRNLKIVYSIFLKTSQKVNLKNFQQGQNSKLGVSQQGQEKSPQIQKNKQSQDKLTKQQNKKMIEDALLESKLYANTQIFNSFSNLLEVVQNNRSIVVLSKQLSGKTALINTLEHVKSQLFSIKLTKINPMALQYHQIFGGTIPQQQKMSYKITKDAYRGVFSVILDKLIAQFKEQTPKYLQNQNIKGIVFDSNLSFKWYQPILSLLDPSNLTFNLANGGSINIPNRNPFKFIFETDTLQDITPALLASVKIVPISINLKWQNIFLTYLETNYPSRLLKCKFLSFMQLMVPFIMDPVLQFYQNSLTSTRASLLGNVTGRRISGHTQTASQLISSTKNNTKSNNLMRIPPVQLVGTTLRMFQSLLQQQFGSQIDGQELITRFSSDAFNFFVFSLIWTVGALISDQNKNTFSRHFKYLIKRAVQINIKGIQKRSLPKDQQFIYDIYYEKGTWKTWENLLTEDKVQLRISNHLISSDFVRVFYILKRYIDQSKSVFLVGKPSQSKNYMFKQYIFQLQPQRFNKNMLSFSPNTSSGQLKETIVKIMLRDKHSHKVKGFMNGKINVIYVCDLNLASVKVEQSQSKYKTSKNEKYTRVIEFLRQFYNSQSFYFNDCPKPYQFKNLTICGTLNSDIKFPTRIMRYMNPLLISSEEGRLQSILKHCIQEKVSANSSQNLNAIFSQVKQKSETLIKCIKNFHNVIKRECQSEKDINFVTKDMFRICSAMMKMINPQKNQATFSKHFLMRRWIYQSESVYSQKMAKYKKEKLFYYINNVLMEDLRERYKVVMPDPTVQITNILTNDQFQQISLANLKQRIIQKIEAQQKVKQIIQTQNQQLKQINQQRKLPIQFLVSDEMVRNLVKLSNGLTIQSPVAFCINRHSRNIRALVKILAFLKQRTLFIYQSKGNPEKQQKREWLEFIKENLLDKLDSHQNIAILIQVHSNSQSSQQSNNPQYILDDLLNLKRIGTLSSLKLAQQEKFLEQQQFSPGYINQNSSGKRSSKKQNKQLANSQDSEEDSIKGDTQSETEQVGTYSIDQSEHKIWAIMHYKQKNADLFKYYQSLLNDSTVVWMTDHIQPSHFEEKLQSAKEYIKMEVNSFVNTFQASSSFADFSVLIQSDIRDYLIQKIFAWIPTLQEIHKKIMKNEKLLKNPQLIEQHNKSSLFFSFLSVFVKIYTQLILNHHQVLSGNQNFIKRIQHIESLTDNLYKELEGLTIEQKNLQKDYAHVSLAIQSEEKQYNFYRSQYSETHDVLTEKQRAYQENKHKYTAQMHKKRQVFEKCRAQINSLVTKQKKLVLTGQLKLCFQLLSLVFGKKKDNEETSKEMMKQFATLKILKKVNTFEPRQLNEKSYEKIRSMIQRANKAPKKDVNNKDLMLHQTQLLCCTLRKYIDSLVECYQKHKSLQNLWTKILQMSKQVQALKSELDKKTKNKNYVEVMDRYQSLVETKKSKVKTIQEVKKKLNNCAEFKELVKQFQNFKVSHKQKLKSQISKAQNRQKKLQNFAIMFGVKIRYESLLNKDLTRQLIQQLRQQSSTSANSLKFFQSQKNFFSQNQVNANNAQPQIIDWEWLQEQVYKSTLNQIFDNFNNNIASNIRLKLSNINCKQSSFEFKQLYMQVYLQKGCVLVQKNAYLDEWIKKTLKKQDKQVQSIVNFIVKRTMKNSKTIGRFFDSCKISQQSNLFDQITNKKSRANFSTFLQLQNANQIYKVLEKQSQKQNQSSKQSHVDLQHISLNSQSTIIIYSSQFDMNIVTQYPLIVLKDLQFQQVSTECYKVFESKKDSIFQFDLKIFALQEKIQQQIDEIHECLVEIERQILLQTRQTAKTNKMLLQRSLTLNQNQDSLKEDTCKKIQEQQFSTKSIALKDPPELKQIPQNFEMSQPIITQFKAILTNLVAIDQAKSDIKLILQQKSVCQNSYSPNFIRLIKFCTKFFFGLKILSQRKYIKQTFSLKNYLKIVKNTVERQVKNTNQRGKLCNSSNIQKIEVAIKKHIFGDLIWQDNTQSHGAILFTFMSVASMQNWQSLSTWKMIDYGLLLSLNVKLNQDLAMKVTKKKNWAQMNETQKALVQKCQELLLHKNGQVSANPYISQAQSFTRLFKSIFTLLSREIPALQPIHEDMAKNQYKWVLFLLSLSDRTVKLPQPFEGYGRVFLLFFILLFKPQLTEKWLGNFSENMGNFTYSANMVANNAYLPLHVKLTGNLNAQFVWTPHWSFQNPLRKVLTIQKQLFYQNIILVQRASKGNDIEGFSSSLRFVLNAANLMKRSLKIVNKYRNKDQNTNFISQAMRQGNWLFLDLQNNQTQILSEIKAIQKANNQNSQQISPQYMLWILVSQESTNKKTKTNLQIVRKCFEACVLQFNSVSSEQIANNYIDYSPLAFYESQSTSKRIRKQYDAMPEPIKVQIYKTLQFFDAISQQNFKVFDLSSDKHYNQNDLFSNYSSILQRIISFEQDCKRSSILDTVKVNIPPKNEVESAKTNQQSKSRLITGKKKTYAQQRLSKKYYTYNVSIKLQNLVVCLRKFYLKKDQNDVCVNIKTNANKLQVVRRETMDDLTRNFAYEVQLNLMLNIAKQCFNHEKIKKSICSHQSIQQQFKSKPVNYIQFLHFCYYGTLHIQQKLASLLNNEKDYERRQNPVYDIMLNQLEDLKPNIRLLRQLVCNIKIQYQKIVLSRDNQLLIGDALNGTINISNKAKELCRKFNKPYICFELIISLGQIAGQCIGKYMEIRRNLEYYNLQSPKKAIEKLQISLKHYSDPQQLIQSLKRQAIADSRLGIDEVDVLLYIVNASHISQICQIKTLSITQSSNVQDQNYPTQKSQCVLKQSALENQGFSLKEIKQSSLVKPQTNVLKKSCQTNKNQVVQKKRIAYKHAIILKGLKLYGGCIVNGLLNFRNPNMININRNSFKEKNSEPVVYDFDNSLNEQETMVIVQFVEKQGQFNKNEQEQRMKFVNERYRNGTIIQVPILKTKNQFQKKLFLKCPTAKQNAAQMQTQSVYISY